MQSSRHSNLSRINLHPVALAAFCLGFSAMLTGCSGNMPGNFGLAINPPGGTVRLTGSVYGGQQPISGSTVQLYTVGTAGIGSASTALIGSTVLSDSNGNFSITGDYSCTGTTPGTQVYLTATGGNPSPGISNANVSLVAALGSCSTLLANANTTFILLNEVTTVAAAYALAPFAVDYKHIGATGTNPSGLVNSFANGTVLANTSTGASGGANVAAGVTVPISRLNTLANIIAACVNTNGSGSAQCTTLFGATGATDTFGAALAIAKNPGGTSVINLYSLSSPSAPFQPSMTAQPNDFTVAVTIAGNNSLSTPYAVAIDAAGDAWVTNEGGSTIAEFSPSGSQIGTYSATGLYGAQGISLDRSGNVWVANTAGNSVIEFTGTSGFTVANTYTAGGINAPSGIANDSAGNAFVANFNGNSITGLSNVGTALSGSPFTGNGNITTPAGVALDPSGNVYVTSGNGTIVKLAHSGVYTSSLTDNTLQGPASLSIDSLGHVFATGFTTGSAVTGALSEFLNGVASTISPTNSGLSSPPAGVATDGTSIWVASGTTNGGLAQFTYGSGTALSPTAGFGSLNTPVGVAVDSSGSVWTANSGSNSLSKFIGIATTVATPIAAAVGP